MSKHLEQIKKNQQQKDSPFSLKGGGFKENQIYPETSDELPDSMAELENQIGKLDTRVWESAWLIGNRLIAIRDKYLKSLDYLNISEYAKEKFDYSHATTVRFIFLAHTFDKSTVRNFGSKLRLLQPLDDNERQKYMEWIEKENPTFRDIEERIKSGIPKIGRPKQLYNISKTKMTIDFKSMGVSIVKDKETEFLKEIELVIQKYSIK